MTDDQLDPEVAAAYQAERRVTDATVAAAGISRDRLLVAALARSAEAPRARTPVRRRWMIAAAAVACISLGYAAGRLTAPPPPPPPAVAPPVAAAPPIDAAEPPIDAVVPPDAPPPVVRTPARGAETREALLIDQASAALRRHLPGDALAALELHAREFPRGQLGEERDVLLIEVALAQDCRADANELIAAYLERYPAGGLRARVEALQRKLDESIRRR